MVYNTYKHLVLDHINATGSSVVMQPKLLDNQLFDYDGGVSTALLRLRARVVVTYRANLLNQQICRIRDCFNMPWQSGMGRAVYANNGSISELGWARRSRKDVVIKARVDTAGKRGMDATMRSLMARGDPSLPREARCQDALVNPSARRQLSACDPGYPMLDVATLTAFEYNGEGTLLFNASVEAWRTWMTGWDIVPRTDVIIAIMRQEGIGNRTLSLAMNSVYNVDEVLEMVASWKGDNHTDPVCDWRGSWMGKHLLPPS